MHRFIWALLAIAGFVLSSCGSSSATPIVRTPAHIAAAVRHPAQPRLSRVFVVVMENHNWSSIAGAGDAPYINNTLLHSGAHAERYYNPPGVHPSEPNYIWLEAGSNLGITDDSLPSANHRGTTAHLTTLLDRAGVRWKAYAEGISGTSCPLSNHLDYAAKHLPFVYFDNVTGSNNPQSAYCIRHVRPYGELAGDLKRNAVARYTFIVPHLCHDMHDTCGPLNDSVRQGDTWLRQHLPTILHSLAYQHGGVVFVTWDEGEGGSDGPIGLIALSRYARVGYASQRHYTHSSLLRTIQEILGVTPLLRDAAHATDLADLFARGTLPSR